MGRNEEACREIDEEETLLKADGERDGERLVELEEGERREVLETER
jgi:hypothetical protein